MKTAGYPFVALVGLDALKLALQLAAIDHRLSLLIRGDKGAGKSTAARGLSELIADSAPFVNLPIGATEDRLLGGLDVEKALKGEPALKRGLIAEANGGVLYVDEVNLLPDHLADSLLDAVASGTHIVEREGFSATQPAELVMVGTMNPEEGALRPQLLDRFALAVEVNAPMDVSVRTTVLSRRLAYDANPSLFRERWNEDGRLLARQLADARDRWASVVVSDEILEYVARCVAERAVRSLRADLAIVRASRALAALENASTVETSHIDRVLPLALVHRASDPPRGHRPPPPPPDRPRDQPNEQTSRGESAERVFAASEIRAPRIVVESGGAKSETAGRVSERGIAIGARPNEMPRELDVRATVLHAAVHANGAVTSADLHEKIRRGADGMRYVFVVDSSGSHAAHERMRFVKGAVAGLLDESQGSRDEVVVVACRGAAAQVVCEPTRARADALRALEYLPTGGRTPLAHALEVAGGFVTERTALVIATDGRANVPRATDDAWADVLTAAAALQCPALVVDTEDDHRRTGRPRQLADALGATCVSLDTLDQSAVVRLIQEMR